MHISNTIEFCFRYFTDALTTILPCILITTNKVFYPVGDTIALAIYLFSYKLNTKIVFTVVYEIVDKLLGLSQNSSVSRYGGHDTIPIV